MNWDLTDVMITLFLGLMAGVSAHLIVALPSLVEKIGSKSRQIWPTDYDPKFDSVTLIRIYGLFSAGLLVLGLSAIAATVGWQYINLVVLPPSLAAGFFLSGAIKRLVPTSADVERPRMGGL